MLQEFLIESTKFTKFGIKFFKEILKPPFELREIVWQSFVVGYKSLALVGVTAFIMGLVLTIQTRPTLVEFGAESWLPAMVSISIVREIGPVITALVCAGRIGSSIGAELGSMKVTEQIDAMEVSGTNPFNYLVVTRVVACTIMLPLLVLFAEAIGIYGAFVGVNMKETISSTLFFNQVFDNLYFSDLVPSVIKSIFFGFAIGLVGCYKGFYCKKGTEGVGRSANSAVVIASLLVFIIDLIAVQITDIFYEL